jgi:hypothetical protein
MQRMKISTAENEIGEGERVCSWVEGKIVFLLLDTMYAQCKRAQCKHKPVYQTGPLRKEAYVFAKLQGKHYSLYISTLFYFPVYALLRFPKHLLNFPQKMSMFSKDLQSFIVF